MTSHLTWNSGKINLTLRDPISPNKVRNTCRVKFQFGRTLETKVFICWKFQPGTEIIESSNRRLIYIFEDDYRTAV